MSTKSKLTQTIVTLLLLFCTAACKKTEQDLLDIARNKVEYAERMVLNSSHPYIIVGRMHILDPDTYFATRNAITEARIAVAKASIIEKKNPVLNWLIKRLNKVESTIFMSKA